MHATPATEPRSGAIAFREARQRLGALDVLRAIAILLVEPPQRVSGVRRPTALDLEGAGLEPVDAGDRGLDQRQPVGG